MKLARLTSRLGARPFVGFAVLVLTTAIAGCQPGSETDSGAGSDESGSQPETADDDTGTGGGGDPGVLVGSFQLQLSEPKAATDDMPAAPGTTSLFGKLYDGPTPQTLVWEMGTESGSCRLFTPRVPFCNTSCGGSAACVEDETCQDYPTVVSAGDVTVAGVATTGGETSFAMTPIANNYQPPAGTTLAYPAFAEGDPITLEVAGGEIAGFELASTGVAQLELDADEIALDSAADVQLGWTAAGAGADSTISVKLDISHHAGTKGMIECDGEDSGSLAIPAALVSELLDLGVAGYPTIIVTRTSTGSATTGAGRVDLVVSSQVERPVTIEGLVSCTDDTECPDGQTCGADLKCS